MNSWVVNWSRALVGEAFHAVDVLFVDSRVVSNFWLVMLWSCFSLLFSRDWGYQCCVGYFRITAMTFALSMQIFTVTFPNKLKGGKIQKKPVFHLIEKAAIAIALGSGFQEMYLSIWWFMRQAKRSNVGFANIHEIFWNKRVLDFHSIASLKFLEELSASVFCDPGIYTADTHSSFLTSSQNSDLTPRFLFT